MNEIAPPYVFMRGQRGIFVEVYFPKKKEYQDVILEALENGLQELDVSQYLSRHAVEIRSEMKNYLQLFDPYQYERTPPECITSLSDGEVEKRMRQYRSRFYGWSIYEVDGAFWNDAKQGLDREKTQVIRLLFRFENPFKELSQKAGCYDVFEALTRWVMAEHNRLDNVLPWSDQERKRFVKLHGRLTRPQETFVKEYDADIAKELKKWIDDITLFIYAYLVRRFWVEVIARGNEEDEIWVASFFTLNLNIAKRQKGDLK